MESVQKQAIQVFCEQRFEPSPTNIVEIIEIFGYSSNYKSYRSLERLSRLHETELESSLAQDPPRQNQDEEVVATFKLVQIKAEVRGKIHISREGFDLLFKFFKLEPYLLHLITFGTFGFHHFVNSQNSPGFVSRACCDKVYPTFFVGTSSYSLMWSFNPEEISTHAIMLLRNANAYETFKQSLMLHKEHLYNPKLLAFVTSIDTVQQMDRKIIDEWVKTQYVESMTGRGNWGYGESDHSAEQLISLSKSIGHCLVNLAKVAVHIEIIRSLLSFIAAPEDQQWSSRMRQQCLNQYRISHEVMRDLVSILRNQTEAQKVSGVCIQERAKSQHSVIFSLLTHFDAQSNIKLANASHDLAEAAKQDTSSMKTIAIMTMVFLPATFFAALFAVPSLQWDAPRVIQDRFWIYWAFTLPSTVTVFVVWFLVTNFDMVKRLLGRSGQKRKARTSAGNSM